ncbi:DUF927 domain-containing protein [Paraburkholderia dipogonis]|uniref:DUF927 domain-containing protein n=1 Tax=Paraburkholderia dipogonis TaxID=1211383 RepID=A0A4Y8N9K6_9BURK|nr:DUF927 domain-containing protein [Paraburkholderia dipogonis]TFE46409.1 DUF927 domain-containing protein [Paraburkholderia dipogonis]
MSDIAIPRVDTPSGEQQIEVVTLKDIQDLTAAVSSPPFEQIAALALDHFDAVVVGVLGLDGEYRGKEFVAFNPKRNDASLGSFKINRETGRFGDFAVDGCAGGDLISLSAFCWGCSNSEAAKRLLDELAKMDLERGGARSFPAPHRATTVPRQSDEKVLVQPIPTAAPPLNPEAFVYQGESLAACYDYVDQDLRLYFSVLRIRKSDASKTFRPVSAWQRPDGKYLWKAEMPAGLRPLFGLSGLKGSEKRTTVFVVEGEKTALALQQMLPESPVLTSAGGARAASKSDWSPLSGCDVVIWRDNDEAGLKYQQDVTAQIRAVEPTTPIAVVNVEALLRAVCAMKGWVYDDQIAELKGWDAADVAALGLDTSVITAAIEQAIEVLPVDAQTSVVLDRADETTIAGVTWRSGKEYRITADAIQVLKKTDSKSFWVNVCSKLEIVRQLRDEEGAGWSLELRIHAPDGTSNTIVLPRSRFTDAQSLKAELMDRGVLIYNWLELQDYLGHAMPLETHKLVRTPGWHGGAYVQSSKTYGKPDEALALDGMAPACNGFGQQGALDTWNNQISRLCIGNSRLMLAVCAALAGPLLPLVGVENGGFHLVGPSSVGKTTALRVAASVFGRPDGFIRSWRSTSNGLESVAAGLNDCVLLIDEMNQATPQEAGEAVYMLGNGQGKIRMTRHGVAGRLLQWRLLFMSTGEIPLQQHLESAGKAVRAGMEVRLLNIPANAGCGHGMFDTLHGFQTSKTLADHLHASTSVTYGVAGDSWLAYLTGQMTAHGYEAFRDSMRNRLTHLESQFARPDADGQVNRAARRFALLALAGEMANEAGIGGWAPGDATAAMQVCFNAWVAERGGVGSSEEAQALRQVQHFFEQYGQSSFQRIESSPMMGDESASEYRAIPQRAGYYRQATDEFYVLAEPFRNRVCADLNLKLVTRVLRGYGLLLGGSDTATTVRLPGLPNPIRAYRISGRIVGYASERQQDAGLASHPD